MSFYRGYNTVGVTFGSTRLEDVELVKRDLLNHFQIRKGEKLMNPDFGTIIWDHLYDPMTPELRTILVDDVNRVLASDPRITPLNVVLSEFELGIQIEAEILFNNLDLSDTLLLQFNGDTQQVTTATL